MAEKLKILPTTTRTGRAFSVESPCGEVIYFYDEQNAHLFAAAGMMREALPDSDRLHLLADWLDIKFPGGDDEIQRHLRRWADLAKAALAAAKPEESDG